MYIPNEAIPDCFKYAKEAFEGKITAKDAINKLNRKHEIKVTSASDYYYYFKYLKTGLGSCRSLSSFTQEYFLKRIYEDYGTQQLKKSLLYFKKLIEKFEGDDVGTKKSMREIYEKHSIQVTLAKK